jgi:hypothetical protein
MIQRKQSIWLLIAVLLNAGLFCFDLYRQTTNTNGVEMTTSLRANNTFSLMLLALIATVLPLISIFLFKNRKRQRGIVLLSIVSVIGFLALMIYYVKNLQSATTPPASGSYWVGSVLPVISVIFMIMAIRGINKDNKLVKSLDRLR